ncbi:TetR/AcrR family transcriptional regulator C-terminal domain-containing protein [Thermopolyspora sp. NPDC052614]|uniref:TetR/AcrR family transcriptional regulator C-terminal domain-containing protein n=1 Tax=Thermopolyspora sp. NPDC052614 TaxID=3155682 RepID=UPI003413816A
MTESAVRREPPYVRIVAEIRRRIEAGELREGDRVPSARQITKEWGVAIATATKVLAALRQEGLAHPRPGVGTVVAAKPVVKPVVEPAAKPAVPTSARTAALPAAQPAETPSAAPGVSAHPPGHAAAVESKTPRPATSPRPARSPERELTRERILAVAIEIADTEGLAALSMRRIATELGVATMSLYRHVPSKDELIVLMYNVVFGTTAYPDPPPEHWRECVEIGARTQWSIYRRHPWVAQAISFTRPIPAPDAVVHTEWLLRALDGRGLTDEQLFHFAVTVANHVRGTAVNFEMEAQARRDTGLTDEQWMQEQDATFSEVFSDGRYPILGRLATRCDVDLTLDSLFEFGLTRLLDGIEVLLSRNEAARQGRRSGVCERSPG